MELKNINHSTLYQKGNALIEISETKLSLNTLIMKFGNWTITETTIEWAGQGLQRFIIEKRQLLETKRVERLNEELYKWIVLATDEDWLTDDDLYDLNFAFVFAAGASRQNLNYEVFDKTLDYQFDILDDEEEFEP